MPVELFKLNRCEKAIHRTRKMQRNPKRIILLFRQMLDYKIL